MKIILKQIKYSIMPITENYQWLVKDDNGRTGIGRTQEEAIGDLVLSYRMPVRNGENIELEINQP